MDSGARSDLSLAKECSNPRGLFLPGYAPAGPDRTCGGQLENLVHHLRQGLALAAAVRLQTGNCAGAFPATKFGCCRFATDPVLECRRPGLPVAGDDLQIMDDRYHLQWRPFEHVARGSHLRCDHCCVGYQVCV